jgi:DNA-binding beta-propeller fold protein YncE
VVAIDPHSGEVVAGIPVGAAPPEVVSGAVPSGAVPLIGVPSTVAASDEWVWVIHENAGAGTISKIDASSRRVVETFSVTGTPVDLLSAAGSLWIRTRQGRIFRIDPSSDIEDESWTLPNAGKTESPLVRSGASLAYGAKRIWAASLRAISQIDPATSRLVPRRSSVWGPLAFGFGSVWTLEPTWGRPGLVRLVPATLKREASIFFGIGSDIAVGEGSVWVPVENGRVWRINPARNTVDSVFEVGGRIFDVAVGFGAVWASTEDGYVVRIGPASGNVERIAIGRVPVGIAVGAGLVWVAVR